MKKLKSPKDIERDVREGDLILLKLKPSSHSHERGEYAGFVHRICKEDMGENDRPYIDISIAGNNPVNSLTPEQSNNLESLSGCSVNIGFDEEGKKHYRYDSMHFHGYLVGYEVLRRAKSQKSA